MIDTETPPRPTSPALRILGWVGLWLCSGSLIPVIWMWSHAFTPQKPLNLPHPGTYFFWPLLGLNTLLASLLTFSLWSDQRKPKRRRTAPVPAGAKSRWRSVWINGPLAGFLILRLLAGNPVMSVNWFGVVGGIAALGVLMVLVNQCTRLIVLPTSEEVTEIGPLMPPVAHILPIGVRPPKNKYRAEVSGREVVYRRPLSESVVLAIMGLFILGMCAGAVWFTLLCLELIYVPGMQRGFYPVGALMMGVGSYLFLFMFLGTLLMIGPRGLRILPSEGTYIYRLAAPVPWQTLTKLITGVLGRSSQDETGLPWRIIEYQGRLQDMAGIQRRESTYKSNTSYSLFLCWHDPARPPMRVGYSTDEVKARAMQTQAAEDLGVPLLPDEVV